jgi:hypothetical protein
MADDHLCESPRKLKGCYMLYRFRPSVVPVLNSFLPRRRTISIVTQSTDCLQKIRNSQPNSMVIAWDRRRILLILMAKRDGICLYYLISQRPERGYNHRRKGRLLDGYHGERLHWFMSIRGIIFSHERHRPRSSHDIGKPSQNVV